MDDEEPGENETGKLTLVINERLKRRFKARAAERGVSVSRAFEEIVARYLESAPGAKLSQPGGEELPLAAERGAQYRTDRR